jgi:hypothetical protein
LNLQLFRVLLKDPLRDGHKIWGKKETESMSGLFWFYKRLGKKKRKKKALILGLFSLITKLILGDPSVSNTKVSLLGTLSKNLPSFTTSLKVVNLSSLISWSSFSLPSPKGY